MRIVSGVVFAALVVACSSTSKEPPPYELDDTRPPTTTVTGADAGSDSGEADVCETVPPNDKCGLDPQCGCAPTETCDVTNRITGATSCITAGTTTLGRPCQETGECAPGLACIYGACRPYCKTPRTKCSVAGTDLCVERLDDEGKPAPNASFCTIECDPRVPSAVCGSNACHWFPTYYAPSKVSDCNYGGTVGHIGTCSTDSDCLPGYACVPEPNNPSRTECERWCRIGQPGRGDCSDLPAAFTCKDYFGDNAPVIGGVKEGLCRD